MDKFSLYELSIMINAIERQRRSAMDEYVDKMNALDGICRKLRLRIDAVQEKKTEELAERGFFEDYGEGFCDE